MTLKKKNYLDLIEDHKGDQQYGLNLFEKVLVISQRAIDLQQMQSLSDNITTSPGYKALEEFNDHKLVPVINERVNKSSAHDEDEEEET